MIRSLTAMAFLVLTPLCQAEDNVLTPEEKKEGFVLLFNGQDFAHFRPSLSYGQWIVEEGEFRTCLFGQAAKYVPGRPICSRPRPTRITD